MTTEDLIEKRKRKQREVAILNMIFGMVMGAFVAVLAQIAGSYPFLTMGGFVFCVAVVWWRIHRTFSVIE